KLKRLVAEKVPFFLLAIASCIVTFYAQKRGGAVADMENVPIEARLENAGIAYVWYLGKALWPVGLGAYYPYPSELRPWPGAAAGAGLAAVTAAALWLAPRAPYL